MEKKLVIFDLDGVLVDACDWHRDAFLAALYKHTNRVVTNDFHKEFLNGSPTKTKLDFLKIEDKELRAAIEKDKQELTAKYILEKCTYNAEVASLLRHLSQAGYILGCYTNSIRKSARDMTRLCGASSYLDVLLTNEDVLEPKPSPEGYLNIMNLFKCSGHNTTIIEDSHKGLEAALRTGARVLQVKNSEDVTLERLLPLITYNENHLSSW